MRAPFTHEQSVRQWLRKRAGGLWWVESGRGGTFGFPDCVLAADGRAVFLELKVAEPKADGSLVVHVGVAQLRVMGELERCGLEAYVLAGVRGERRLLLLAPSDLERRAGASSSQRKPFQPTSWRVQIGASGAELWEYLARNISGRNF